MTEQNFSEWVDDYVRDRLPADEEAAFEEALLEDAELQAQVEVALGMREALNNDSELELQGAMPARPSAGNSWSGYALAASVALAIVSTTLYWQAGVENDRLINQIESLGQPVGSVLHVPVNIMRSGGQSTPDVIVQKPEGRAAILLDIELGTKARGEAQLSFELLDPSGEPVLTWQSSPTSEGRTSVVLSSEQIPASRLWLQISDSSGNELERRLLEFRPAN